MTRPASKSSEANTGERHAIPGVKSATLANVVPLFNGGFGRTLFREGEDSSNGQNGQVTQLGSVASDYLQTMGIPLLRGQGFDSTVREDSPGWRSLTKPARDASGRIKTR